MAHLSGTSKVTPISNTPFLLDDFLRPFWKCLRYIGFQHGFLGPVEERRVFYILRCVSTTLIILSVCNLGIFQLVKLLQEILDGKTFKDVLLNIYISMYFAMAFVCLLQLYSKYDKLIEFLQEWKQIETSFDHCSNQKRTTYVASFLHYHFIYVYLFFPVVFIWNLTQPDLSVFFTSIKVLRELFGLHFLSFYWTVCNIFSTTLIVLGNIIPAFIFYQAGCMIENLKLQLDDCPANFTNSILSANENPYRFLWKKYESIQKLVDSANQLFGVVIIVNQFSFICINCLSIYALTEETNFNIASLNHSSPVINCTFQTVLFTLLFSHLPRSCGDLKQSISVLLSEKWHLMPQDHQNYLNSFFNRLNGGEMAASPLGLYTIDRSNLLSLLTLEISYTIVLLQS